MRIVAHISDLHFGRDEPAVAEALLRDLRDVGPALVAVSGDLTQRARTGQFRAAREFLDRIPFPQLVVPGNHDIPLYDVIRRFMSPLGRYRRHITPDLQPAWRDGGIAVVGVNTARSATWKNGRISVEQIEHLRGVFCGIPDDIFKVLVAHHPFVPPPGQPSPPLVGRGFRALRAIGECGADLVLAGHLHVGFAVDVSAQKLPISSAMLIVQAGTAISNRHRNEPNTYNVLTIDPPGLTLEVRAFDGQRFERSKSGVYERREGEWRVLGAPGPELRPSVRPAVSPRVAS
ncbi:MAG: metallophosphoesterase [Gemmatimonadetes bacterium]|nr:metallophosphoesterase [Gemmatimonadota bacterium]